MLSAPGAAGLFRDRWLGTAPAFAGCLSYPPLFLGKAPVVLHALWVPVPGLFVLPAGHLACLFGGRYLLGRSAGGWLCRLLLGDGLGRSLFLAPVRLSSLLPLLGEVDCVLKYLSFCMVDPRPRGASYVVTSRRPVILGKPPSPRGIFSLSPLRTPALWSTPATAGPAWLVTPPLTGAPRRGAQPRGEGVHRVWRRVRSEGVALIVSPHKILKELRSNTPSRCPAGHAQEPSRPHAPGRNSLSRSPKVTGRDLLPPKPRTLKPRGKLAGSTTRPGTGPLSAGSTSDNSHKNSGKGPRNSASAGTAPSPPYRARHAAPPAAEAHRQSRRQSDANRRAAAKEKPTTGQADQRERNRV